MTFSELEKKIIAFYYEAVTLFHGSIRESSAVIRAMDMCACTSTAAILS